MTKQTKEHRISSQQPETAAENSSSSEQKRAGISQGEDCGIQTLEIDGVRKQLSRPGMSVVNFVVKPLPGLISLAI